MRNCFGSGPSAAGIGKGHYWGTVFSVSFLHGLDGRILRSEVSKALDALSRLVHLLMFAADDPWMTGDTDTLRDDEGPIVRHSGFHQVSLVLTARTPASCPRGPGAEHAAEHLDWMRRVLPATLKKQWRRGERRTPETAFESAICS